MLKIYAKLPDPQHFRRIQNKGERFQWEDKASDRVRIIAPIENPWDKNWAILVAIDRGKTKAGIEYPQRLTLTCFAGGEGIPAKIIRERWTGQFVHSIGPTLFFSGFQAQADAGRSWLMYSIANHPK